MSGNQAYRERDRGGDRDVNYRSGYNNRGGGFRGRGGVGGYKPRRYWDSDDYYKDERDHGRGRRRRSYSRSRSRSHSYSSRSRSRSRTPTRRGRSRSPHKPEEISERPMEQPCQGPKPQQHEPYVPSKDPAEAWSASRMHLPQEYIPHSTNGQAPVTLNPMNPYGSVEPTAYPSHYQEAQQGISSVNNPNTIGFSYGHTTNLMSHTQYQQPPQQPPNLLFPHGVISQSISAAPPPPALTETKVTKDDGSSEGSKKKKDKRKKKRRHHSSSSSSSSSDDSSESRRRRKSKKEHGSSDSSSDEEKKDSTSSSALTTAQKDALLKQRDGYQTKLEILEREIAKLQNKEDELVRSRADRKLIDENLNLQAELKGRCKAVLIVLEKIDDVLKVGNKTSSSAEKPRSAAPSETHPPPQPLKVISEPYNTGESSRKGPFDYFDNGQHWCRLCNVFPETVEQMLAHFHSKEHHDQIQQLGIDEKPWHKRNSVFDSKPSSGARKAPLRGMQFFSPVEGWYCRLCNNWMGDPHCAVEHLKSDEHNNNYMNFLEEHPDWEHKWVSDRERALGISGKQDSTYSNKKSRFDDSKDIKLKTERKPVSQQEDLESGKSIRVQMRNSLKGEERGNLSQFPPAAQLNEVQVQAAKDPGLEEWISKPKVTVDIIDTQKFAAIVRQKHGTKEKEAKESKSDVPDTKSSPAAPPTSLQKDKDYKKEKDDRRRPDKVELQISNRDKDRERYRDRDNRGSRRRSRSRSRSRSRDRRYNRRRSRSRSRSRERSDRDRRDRGGGAGERERPEFKETVKKLPMIGKMPLYKRPVINREKPEVERSKVLSAEASPAKALPPVGFLPKEVVAKNTTENTSLYSESPSNSMGYSYKAHPSFDLGSSSGISQERYSVPSSAYAHIQDDASMDEDIPKDFQHTEGSDDVPSGNAKEDKEDTPAALPDDFQQALDIIYAVNTPQQVPQPVPPPSASAPNGVSEDTPTVTESTEYGDYSSNGYGNYMGYQPYQQSFDGYAPVGYEELDDGPPGVGDENTNAGGARPPPMAVPPPASDTAQLEKAVEKDPPPPGDDDMEDLRMLGIDVDDSVVG